MAEAFYGNALAGAVEVAVDGRGAVVEVRLAPAMLGRLWPEQLGQGVVSAHAEARAAAMEGG